MQRVAGTLLAALAFAACSKGEAHRKVSGPAVRVDGSSTVYLVSKIMAEEAQKKGIATAVVDESGTTGGFKKFCAGETDVSGASRPIQTSEIDACKHGGVEFIELPVGYDGLAVVVNAANDWANYLTVDELKKVWSPQAMGAVTTWKQVRDTFPDEPVHLFGPGDESGTFDYFTQAIVGEQRASRTDYTASEDDMVLVHGIASDKDALGYFGFAYVVHNSHKLRAVPIDDGHGPIAPSSATVSNGTYQPLSRPIFIYVNKASLQRPEVQAFVAFYLDAARELSAEVGYVPLPQHADQLAKERFKARRTGTMFGGGPPMVGVTMERLLEAEFH